VQLRLLESHHSLARSLVCSFDRLLWRHGSGSRLDLAVATGCGSGVPRCVASVVGLVLVACRAHSFNACGTSMASSS